MKSQKISNRAPRPFKTKTDRWSGGHGAQGFIPSSKPVVRPAKPSPPAADKAAEGNENIAP